MQERGIHGVGVRGLLGVEVLHVDMDHGRTLDESFVREQCATAPCEFWVFLKFESTCLIDGLKNEYISTEKIRIFLTVFQQSRLIAKVNNKSKILQQSWNEFHYKFSSA